MAKHHETAHACRPEGLSKIPQTLVHLKGADRPYDRGMLRPIVPSTFYLDESVCCAPNTTGEHNAIIALYTNIFFMLSLLFFLHPSSLICRELRSVPCRKDCLFISTKNTGTRIST